VHGASSRRAPCYTGLAGWTTKRGKTRIVRPLRGGQITIPIEFRRELGIEQDSVLHVTLDDKELRIRRLETVERAGERDWFGALYDLFAPVRQEAIDRGYTDEEINKVIDEAAAEVRTAGRGGSQRWFLSP
jgi:bifunctional DNA-binding transcriptional regulator/antitoxin component of YhaV-PrlF toxin-antitoxin module